MIDGPWLYPAALLLGFLLDLLLGDPRGLPHPVRGIGLAISALERVLRTFFTGARGELAGGVVLVLVVAGGAYLAAAAALAAAGRICLLAELATATCLVYVTLAVKDMGGHVGAVEGALREGGLSLARTRVAMLVSRDCSGMDRGAAVGASLESLFENTADAVAAPLFYAALGGPALAFMFKAASTMDSMVGYKSEPYRYFGWAAAKLDDLLCFIPARLSALVFLCAGWTGGAGWRRGWTVLMADKGKHDSPNSAWPEAAAAAVLGLRLGGPAVYAGVKANRPYLNAAGRVPQLADLRRGLRLFYRASFVTWVLALLLAAGMAALKGTLP